MYERFKIKTLWYPKGLTKKDIPYEGQIIRVADEYDAIVSKRQYKSHIGISDTLKILIENTKPVAESRYSSALNEIAENTRLGKNNPVIVRTLFKVVIDDIEYEIYCTQGYVDKLKTDIKRIEQMLKYKNKMEKAKKDKEKNYYLEGIKMLLEDGENIENLEILHDEYIEAYNTRKAIIDNLYKEIKVIKKLRV